MKVGIDVDGVLAAFDEAYGREIERICGYRVELPARVWDFDAGVDTTPVWDYIKESRHFWLDLPTLPGATDFLMYLSLANHMSHHEIYFITARPGHSVKSQTERWLTRYGMRVPTVVPCKRKGLLASCLSLDLMLDDKPENLFNVRESFKPCKTVLFEALHNGWAHEDPRIDMRIKTLHELQTTLTIA